MTQTFVARIGRWCFRHKWTVLAGWLVAVAIGVVCAGPVFSSLTNDRGPSSLESVAGSNQLNGTSTSAGTVVGVVTGVDPDAAAVRQAVTRAATDIGRIPGVASVVTPYQEGLPAAGADGRSASSRAGVIAKDQRGLLIQARLGPLTDGATDTATDAVAARMHALAPELGPQADVLVGGGNLINREVNGQAQKDLSTAEELSLPITLVILVIVFGGLLAAGVPVLGAVVAVAGSFGLLLAFSKVTNLDSNAITVVTLLGLGLSVDYGLLLVARYRDEITAGHEPAEAVGRAWATAGRTIVFSGLTVAAALSGMLVFGLTGLSALGAAGISITLVSVLVAMTFTAALLGMFGRRVRPSKRSMARLERRQARHGDARADGRSASSRGEADGRSASSRGEADGRSASSRGDGFFAGLARAVQRRPLVTALATGALLLGAGLPLLSTTVVVNDLDVLPRSLDSVKVLDILADQYGVARSTAVVVVARTDPATLDQWASQRFTNDPDVARFHSAEQVTPGVSRLNIDPVGPAEGPAALRVVDAIRADRPPAQASWVTGDAAFHRDILGLILHRLPWAIGLALGAMVVLLFAMTGSLVAPIKAVVMNVVSLGASFGVLSAVFEHGVLSGLLHTTTVSGITPFVIVIVFAFAFGLSMDYEVFLLARIKENVDNGVPNDEAVRRGLQRSGRIITSAALLLVVVFSCFLVARVGNIQQIGLGLAVAVLVDATLVRCVLVPATMTLLGRFNWWAPRPLTRLHRRLGLDRHLAEQPSTVDTLEPARV
jgi:RND superfamily putative drug exporter